MQELRIDARRAMTTRRERDSTTPARLTFPLLCAVVTIGAAATLATALGLPLALILGITALVAILGAFAAHRTVGSMLAGVTLLVVRPYAPGERVRLHLPPHGTLEAELVRVGLANTTLATPTGLLVVPNSRLLRGVPQQAAADLS
jgi:small-conductance mechanosensitive channel